MKRIKYIIVLASILLLPLKASADDVVTLTNGEWAPYTSADLKHKGVFSRIVSEAFAIEGITVKYKFYPWKRSYKLAAEGSMDGSVTWAPTPDREKDFFFSEPVTFNQKVFFHRKDFNFDWTGIEALKGFNIGATSQYTYGGEFDQAAENGVLNVSYVNDDKQNIRKLMKGRIDVFPMEREVGYGLINSLLTSDDASLLTHHPTPIQETPISIVISKKIDPARARYLVAAFNKGLQKLKNSGRYDQFVNESRRGDYLIN